MVFDEEGRSMKPDSHKDRLRRIHSGLAAQLHVVGDALANGYALDDAMLREISLALSRLSNEARVAVEAGQIETRPLFPKET